ncbi:MAG: hypothetical protein ACI82G_000232 [Bradymonadia bacterium]|jgi:hypothetical protein
MASRYIGPNWNRLAQISALVSAVMAAFVLHPMATCLTVEWDEVQLTQVDGSGANDGRHSLNNEMLYEVREGFLGDVWAGTKYCSHAYPLGTRPLWAQLTALFACVGYFVFKVIGRIEYKRQVRRTSSQQRTARHNVVKQRTSQTTGGSPVATVRERPGGHTGQPRRATSSAIGLERATSGPWDPLSNGGEDVLDRLDRAIVDRNDTGTSPNAPQTVDADFGNALPSLDEWDDEVTDTVNTSERVVSAGTALAQSLDEASISGIRTGTFHVGAPLSFLLEGVTRQNVPKDLRVTAHVLREDGSRECCFVDRMLFDVSTVEEHRGGALVRVAWRHVAIAVLDHTRDSDGSLVGVRVEVNQQSKRFTSEAPLVDVLRLSVRDQFGGAATDKRLIAIAADGRVHSLIADGDNHLIVPSLPPGRVRVSAADRGLMQLPSGETVSTLDLTTTGVTFATPTATLDPDHAHQLTIWRYNRWWVAPGAEAGDGTERRPFGSVEQALQRIAERRHAGDDAKAYDEVRIAGASSIPSGRLGVTSEVWRDWWNGKPASTSELWTQPVEAAEIVAQFANDHSALREDIDIVGLERIRLISLHYAEFFDRLNESEEPLRASIAEQLGTLPLAAVCRPPAPMVAPFRLAVRNCKQVTLFGLHLVGGRGQSGLHIQDSHHIYAVRLWIEGFQSGLTNQESSVAVGRGLQVDRSGRGPDDARVRIERCDIGTNRAHRRSMPIRGGGIAVYESIVEMDGCYVHHNLASQDPAAITADKASGLSGANNHREENAVVSV